MQTPEPSWLTRLTLARLRLTFRTSRACRPGYFIGPDVRGSMGVLLKRYMGCHENGDADCHCCEPAFQSQCLYAPFFLHGGQGPRPMALRLETAQLTEAPVFATGATLRFELRLIGRAAGLGLHIGKERTRFELTAAEFLDAAGRVQSVAQIKQIPIIAYPFDGLAPVYNDQQRVRLHCLSPLEITLQHGKFVRNPDDLSFRHLVVRMLDRFQHLAQDRSDRHGARNLVQQADRIKSASHGATWQRIALRNRPGRMQGGLVGKLDFSGDLAPFSGLLTAVAALGLGKAVPLGFGQVAVEWQDF